MQRSYLLAVSQLRSQNIIELLHKKAIVAAIAWASLYLKLKRIECDFKERLSIQKHQPDIAKSGQRRLCEVLASQSYSQLVVGK